MRYRTAGWLCIVVAAALGVIVATAIAKWLASPELKRRDYTAIYLLSSAVADGIDPMLDLPVIAGHYDTPSENLRMHPTPHSPTLGLLMLPLSRVPYSTSSLIWLGIGFAALLCLLALSLRLAGFALPPPRLVLLTFALVAWDPVKSELQQGQVMIVIGLLSAGAIWSVQRGRMCLAGLLVAVALLLKPVTWPLAVLLLLRRQWRAFVVCSSVTALGYVAAFALIGFHRLPAYLHAFLEVMASYGVGWTNIAPGTIGTRLFGHVVMPPYETVLVTEPILDAPLLAMVLVRGVPLVILGWAFVVSRRLRIDHAAAVVLGASILSSPVLWLHYLTVLFGPVALLVAALRERPDLQTARWIAWCCLAVALVPTPLWETLPLATLPSHETGPPAVVTGVAALPALAPALCVLIVTVQIARLGEREPMQRPTAASWTELASKPSNEDTGELVGTRQRAH